MKNKIKLILGNSRNDTDMIGTLFMPHLYMESVFLTLSSCTFTLKKKKT